MCLAGPERFELPTAGFEDQNSSTELRTDGALNKDRTCISRIPSECNNRYTMRAWPRRPESN